MLVLNEADEMLDRGFAPDVERILAYAPPTRQTALFSATLPGWVAGIAARHVQNAVTIEVDAETAEPVAWAAPAGRLPCSGRKTPRSGGSSKKRSVDSYGASRGPIRAKPAWARRPRELWRGPEPLHRNERSRRAPQVAYGLNNSPARSADDGACGGSPGSGAEA